MLRRLFLVLRVFAAKEQPAMHFWMQRFYAAAKHFRPAGKIRNVAHGHARFS